MVANEQQLPPLSPPSAVDLAGLDPHDIAELAAFAAVARRRALALARLALAAAVVLGLVALVAAVTWARLRARAAGVADEALVEAFGMRIPDPRPAVLRAELRLRSVLAGAVALVAALIGAGWLGVWMWARPPRVARRRVPPSQPPI